MFVDPYYLATFLNCKFGQFQSFRESTGNVQLNLFIDKIKKIVVPTGNKFNEIGKLTKQAYDKRRESEALYAEAEQLLLQELGLDNLDLSPQTSYVAYFDETVEAKRIDAEYFQPKYEKFYNQLETLARSKNWNIQKYKNLSSKFKYGISDNLNYIDSGVPFLRIADLDKYRFDPKELKFVSLEAAKKYKLARVKTGDVLISRSGTLGLAITIPQELEGAIFGSYFIVTRPNPEVLNPTYLALYVNSLTGKLQTEQANTGGIQTNLTISVLERLKIVCPSLEIQHSFIDFVNRSYKAEDQSKKLLEIAKTVIEKLILENDERAINWMNEQFEKLNLE